MRNLLVGWLLLAFLAATGASSGSQDGSADRTPLPSDNSSHVRSLPCDGWNVEGLRPGSIPRTALPTADFAVMAVASRSGGLRLTWVGGAPRARDARLWRCPAPCLR
jgi:hypothetical protein